MTSVPARIPRIRVDRLHLADVVYPDWHPRAAERTCPVFGFAIRHPDGVILFDTGVGAGHAVIDEWYRPAVTPLLEALNGAGIDERDVLAVVNSHLHFDHCGQNATLLARGVPVHVHEAELATLTATPHYTVPEWAAIPDDALRVVRGDERLADGVTVVETPGHTPGHLSLVVDTGGERIVVAGQCVYRTGELAARAIAPDNMHDDTFAAAGQESLERLLALAPCRFVAAHDAADLRA